MKIESETCGKCGMEIEVPDFDETGPVSEYFPKWEQAVLKHGWQHHREDFPPEFKSFTQFMKWLRTSDGKHWNRQQGKWRMRLLNGFVTIFSRRGYDATPRRHKKGETG